MKNLNPSAFPARRARKSASAKPGGVAPLATPAALEVAQLQQRIAYALAQRPTSPALIGAQLGLRDAITAAPRHLFGSPRWRAYRAAAIERFDAMVAASRRRREAA